MDFDPLFEDLEARFVAVAETSGRGFSLATLGEATSLDLHLADGQKQPLIAPMLGLDFVAGIKPGSLAWTVVPLKAIRSMSFDFDEAPGLPTLNVQKVRESEHLEKLPLPANCSFRTFNSDEGQARATLVGIAHELLFLQTLGSARLSAIPLSQVSQLEITPVDNSSEES